MMDLNILDSTTRGEEGAELEIKHPKTGRGTGFFLTIKGADSKCYKTALKELMKKSSPDMTSNDLKADLLVRCTTGWRAEEIVDGKAQACAVLVDGKEVKYSEAALRSVLVRMPTVREQGAAFQEDRGNFLPVASGN